MDTVYWVSLIVGGFFVLLSIFGGTDSEADVDVDADIDMDFDVDADVSLERGWLFVGETGGGKSCALPDTGDYVWCDINGPPGSNALELYVVRERRT